MPPHYQDELVSLHHGDCLDVLRSLPDASVDAVITDPPYGLSDLKPAQVTKAIVAWASGDRENVPDARGFMGRSWDAFVPPPAVWDECYRVLKPGGHIAAFAGSRTADLMGLSIRLAGFEIRDGLQWLYSQGFPKSLDVGKAIDKQANAAPLWDDIRAHIRTWRDHNGMKNADLNRAVGSSASGCGMARHWTSDAGGQHAIPSKDQWLNLKAALGWPDCDLDAAYDAVKDGADRPVVDRRLLPDRPGFAGETYGTPGASIVDITAAATPEAQRWSGWGTALKPAHEPIVCAQKPFNAVPSWDVVNTAHEPIVLARKPLAGTVAANVLQFGTGALNIDATRVGSGDKLVRPSIARSDNEVLGKGLGAGVQLEPGGRWPANVLLTHAPDCDDSACQPGCPVSELDAQGKAGGSHGAGAARGHYTVSRPGVATNFGGGAPNGGRYGDDGGVSRFFPSFRYQAKAPTSERPKVNGIAHPTTKPLAVMSWLAKLLVAPGGTVLEPFAGSGTTVEACIDEGFAVIAVEREAEYLPLIQHRIDRANARAELAAAEAAAAEVEPDQPALFSA